MWLPAAALHGNPAGSPPADGDCAVSSVTRTEKPALLGDADKRMQAPAPQGPSPAVTEEPFLPLLTQRHQAKKGGNCFASAFWCAWQHWPAQPPLRSGAEALPPWDAPTASPTSPGTTSLCHRSLLGDRPVFTSTDHPWEEKKKICILILISLLITISQ